ncbi:unnamed protein product, partial [Polarella glacialis]
VHISRQQRDAYRIALNATAQVASKDFLRFDGVPPPGVVQPWNTDIGMNNRLVRQQGARQVVSFPMLNPPAEDGGSVKNDDLWAYGALALVGVAVLVGVIALVFVVNSRSKRSRAMLPEGSDSDQDHGQLL